MKNYILVRNCDIFGPNSIFFSLIKKSKIAIFFGPKLRYYILVQNCDIFLVQNCDIILVLNCNIILGGRDIDYACIKV